MALLQLRNHIPMSGPARSESADGTESYTVGVSLGFELSWFHKRCGINFSESEAGKFKLLREIVSLRKGGDRYPMGEELKLKSTERRESVCIKYHSIGKKEV